VSRSAPAGARAPRPGDGDDAGLTNRYWGRPALEAAILSALAAAGRDLDSLSVSDLAAADQFHAGGRPATQRLARLAQLAPGWSVLDVGGGLGGPARTLAVEFGCRVTVVDLTESYVDAGRALTARLGLGHAVTHRVGDARSLPHDIGPFDVVWTQNSSMNIADKEGLYAGFAGALRPGGRLALQEPMAGPVEPPIYPLMWARDASASFLRRPEAMRAAIEAAGFRALAWQDVTHEAGGPAAGANIPAHAIQRIVMGDALDAIIAAGHRNREEGRLVLVQAVFERTGTAPAPSRRRGTGTP
jgi:SAM-dependent methyltransferase